ncbi:MAG: hypothetical protein R6T98_10775 [Desulfatiglandales bacterium]
MKARFKAPSREGTETKPIVFRSRGVMQRTPFIAILAAMLQPLPIRIKSSYHIKPLPNSQYIASPCQMHSYYNAIPYS